MTTQPKIIKRAMSLIRTITRSVYGLQKLRIETGNRICANFRAKLGLDEEISEAEAKKVLKELKRRFLLITDGIVIVTARKKYAYDGVITCYTELALIAHYLSLKIEEKRTFLTLGTALKDEPIYTQFLKGVLGCGPAMGGVIVSEIDITKAKYASSLHRYAGLDVAADGRGRSRRKEHLIDIEYEAADKSTKTRRGITFNPFLKTKLVGVLAGCLLKAGGEYKDHYDRYKHRIATDPKHDEKSKGHRHNMAMRYMIKMFLSDLYVAWRKLEGLEVYPTYHEAKQGHVHE